MKILLAAALLALTACTTTQKKVDAPSAPTPAPDTQTVGENIDYQAIKTALKLDRPVEQLGYAEKSFNSCDMGYGYSRNQNCRNLFLVTLNVRLLRRDTEGTISTILTENDVAPIAGQTVRWSLKRVQGSFQTDGLGYGQVLAVSPRSERTERVKLALGREFLYMRANEITRVITPKPWCSP